MASVNRRGFFLKPSGPITAQTNIPSSGLGWSKKAIVKITSSTAVRFLNRYGSNVYFGSGTLARYSKSGTVDATQVGYSYPTNSTPFEWEVVSATGGSGQAVFHFYKDGEYVVSADAANNDGATFSNNIILDGADFPNAEISYLEAHNTDSTSIQTFDANKVLNAAGDGFVDRLQADYGNVAAAADYNLYLYDTSDPASPHHATVPAGSTWTLDIDFNETVGTVKAGQNSVILTFSGGFQPVSATIGGFPCEITDSVAGSVTLSFPELDTVNSYPKFGNQVLAVIDSLGNQITQIVDWQAPEGFDYTTLLTDGDTSSNASMFYQWGVAGTIYADAEAPVADEQAVYELQYIKNVTAGDVANGTKSGIMTIADNAPADWTSTAYLIDNNGAQSFIINSGVSSPPDEDNTKPVINIPVENPLTITVGDTFTTPTATVTDNVDGDMGTVEGTGTVDTSTAGTYTITYSGSGFTDSAGNTADDVILTVIVEEPVDTTLPVITLLGDNPVNLTVGDTYTEFGATATDNADGDISSDLVISGTVDTSVAGSYNINYDVQDSSGNNAITVTRQVIVSEADVENTRPVIYLTGSPSITHGIGMPYVDQGATAYDEEDGDLTDSIVVTGSVDTTKAGTNILYYDVTDSEGLQAYTVTRVVTVASRVVADAGRNLRVKSGDEIILNGTASYHIDDFPLEYEWSVEGLSSNFLSNPNQAITKFNYDVLGRYYVTLTVRYGEDVSTDTISVTITDRDDGSTGSVGGYRGVINTTIGFA